ncbi:hypothetical protein ACM64Y_12120 [Novispirillum sp. DQ9]|uniref:hypothetical protein n=1 Tax=Novispirillum sp. DQ9 TaxID=3398612 RepID=UPI003C7C0AD8
MSFGKYMITGVAGPLGGVVWDVMRSATAKVEAASSGEMAELQLEAARQDVRLKMAKVQAQIAQEMAIADRIASAAEVEIEEFYDAGGKGNVGLSGDLNTLTGTLGVGAEGRVVTKRIYHFKGWRPEMVVAEIDAEGNLTVEAPEAAPGE